MRTNPPAPPAAAQPLLVKSSVASLSDERVVHDAFGLLMVATGGMASARPPPLWKITMLTIVSLELIIWPITGSLLPMLTARGLHLAAATCVCSFITVFLNTYVGLPLMQFLFGAWLRLPRPSPADLSGTHALLDAGMLVGWSPSTLFAARAAVVVCYVGALVAYGTWLYLVDGGAQGFH